MKLLLTGDWHLRFKRPEMRLDEDYFVIQFGKVKQILEVAQNKECDLILQPGDFFDSVETPWFVIQKYILEMKNDEVVAPSIGIITVPGQHDMRFHTRQIENTPLGVMEAASLLSIMREPVHLGKHVWVYGSWWGQEIPTPDTKGLNILLAHKMVVDEKLWSGQEDFVYANQLFRQYPYDLFVFGDNHRQFVLEKDGRFVVNAGSLMRANVDQADHRPAVYVYDTDDRTLERIELKVRPVREVLDLKRAKEVRERDEKMEAFVEGLKVDQELGLDFVESLYSAMDVNKADKEMRGMVEEILR